MNPPLTSTKKNSFAQWLGSALVVLVFYAMLSAVVLLVSFVLLQRGMTPDLPWISVIQNNLYMKGMRSIWQNKIDCVAFDGELIYKPKLGICQFNNAEFSTTLNFSADGRYTGDKPAGSGIAVIGDSHAMGWGVHDEETFSAELQSLSKRPVYNLAVSSYGTVREVLRLELSGVLSKVDTLIIQYCDNDIEENQHNLISGTEENRRKFERITQGEKSQTSLLRVIAEAYGYALRAPYNGLKSPKPPADFSPHYQAFMKVLAQHPELKEKRILVFYTNAHGRQFQGFPAGRDKQLANVEFVDLGLAASDYYRIDDHLTPAGHKKAAQQLFDLLQHPQ